MSCSWIGDHIESVPSPATCGPFPIASTGFYLLLASTKNQYGHEDLVSGRMRWTDLTPAEWRDSERALTELKAIGAIQPIREGVLPERWQPGARVDGRRTVSRRWEHYSAGQPVRDAQGHLAGWVRGAPRAGPDRQGARTARSDRFGQYSLN